MRIDFNPDKITYPGLLEAFWAMHNPTTRNRPGPDRGTQYRSAIFFHTPEQEAQAKASRDAVQADSHRHVVTEMVPATAFYTAEDYHQRYLEKQQGRASCAVTLR